MVLKEQEEIEPVSKKVKIAMITKGVEPSTLALLAPRSNQLS
jgi:hypothetical protein